MFLSNWKVRGVAIGCDGWVLGASCQDPTRSKHSEAVVSSDITRATEKEGLVMGINLFSDRS